MSTETPDFQERALVRPQSASLQEHADATRAETLIRSMALALANGAPIKDLDEIVRRNAGQVSRSDLVAGRLSSNVLGDIINTVEQSKAAASFDWRSATSDQIRAYLSARGIDPRPLGYGDPWARMADARGGGSANRSEASGGYSGNLGSITQDNFAHTPFATTGLSYANFNNLRAQGFDAAQITSAVNTNKALGLGANDNPGATARLQRDVPEAITGLHETRENWTHFYELKKAHEEAIKRGDHAAAAKFGEEMEQARKRADEHDKHEQDKVKSKKPERVDDVVTQQKNIKRRANEHINHLAPGDDAKAKQLATAVDQARRSDDPKAIDKTLDKYAAATVDDREKRTAMAGLRKELEKDKKLKTAQKKDNVDQKKDNVAQTNENEVTTAEAATKATDNADKREMKGDKLALLNDDNDTEKPTTTPTQKAESKPKSEAEKSPAKPTKTAKAAPKNSSPAAGA